MSLPSWYPDEKAHAGDEHLDPHYVETYDRKAGTDPTSEVALLLDLGLNKDRTLIDFGAGTGTFALAVAPHCRRVIAVDISPAMLAGLSKKASSRGIENIETVHGGFLSFGQTGEHLDFAYSRHALHHLPDFWKAIALRRISSVLRPGAIFRLVDLVYSFDPAEADDKIGAWLAGAASDAKDGWTRPELDTHLKDEYSTFSWLLEPMLEKAGFEIRDTTHDPPGSIPPIRV